MEHAETSCISRSTDVYTCNTFTAAFFSSSERGGWGMSSVRYSDNALYEYLRLKCWGCHAYISFWSIRGGYEECCEIVALHWAWNGMPRERDDRRITDLIYRGCISISFIKKLHGSIIEILSK